MRVPTRLVQQCPGSQLYDIRKQPIKCWAQGKCRSHPTLHLSSSCPFFNVTDFVSLYPRLSKFAFSPSTIFSFILLPWNEPARIHPQVYPQSQNFHLPEQYTKRSFILNNFTSLWGFYHCSAKQSNIVGLVLYSLKHRKFTTVFEYAISDQLLLKKFPFIFQCIWNCYHHGLSLSLFHIFINFIIYFSHIHFYFP